MLALLALALPRVACALLAFMLTHLAFPALSLLSSFEHLSLVLTHLAFPALSLVSSFAHLGLVPLTETPNSYLQNSSPAVLHPMSFYRITSAVCNTTNCLLSSLVYVCPFWVIHGRFLSCSSSHSLSHTGFTSHTEGLVKIWFPSPGGVPRAHTCDT